MKKVLLLILLAGSITTARAETPSPSSSAAPLFSLSASPSFTIPLGADSTLFSLGGGAALSGRFTLPPFPMGFLGVGLGYSFVPLQKVTALSLLHAGVEAGLRVDMLAGLTLRAFGTAGYSYGFLVSGGDGGGTPYIGAGVDLAWTFLPPLSLAAGASYRYFFDLYNDLAVTLAVSLDMRAEGARPAKLKVEPSARPVPLEGAAPGVIIKTLTLDSLFPILHTFYDSNPIGSLILKNAGSSPVTDVTVSLIVRQFMDAPKQCARCEVLEPGDELSLDLFGLFKNNVFEIKQSTKVPAELTVTYTLGETPRELDRVETVKIYDRNAMSWDDTNKAAAFVMPKEPAVLMLSNQINSLITPSMNAFIDRNLQTAIGLHEALRLLGIAYVSPPLTSYAAVSRNRQAVDSVKFPLETIQYRSGDCSDLSVLYNSLLESVQVETAFITIPGHIFIAFALASSEEEVRRTFSHTDEFIFREGKAWVPVEVTEREGSFLAAWQAGAREWRENLANSQADFYPVREAWVTYEPVNYPGIGGQPPLPEAALVVKEFREGVRQIVTREISDRETELLSAAARSNNSPRDLNALGVLYARYDLLDKAEPQFLAAARKGEYGPALLNLGNLRLRMKRPQEALGFYERAARAAPHDPLVLLGLARSNHELQNYGLVKAEYDELKAKSPELAQRYAYLRLQGEEATRAREMTLADDAMLWEEEK